MLSLYIGLTESEVLNILDVEDIKEIMNLLKKFPKKMFAKCMGMD